MRYGCPRLQRGKYTRGRWTRHDVLRDCVQGQTVGADMKIEKGGWYVHVLTVWYSTNVILGHRARVICSQRVDACKNATVLLSTLISSSYGEPVHKQGDDLDVRLFRHMHSNNTLHIIIFNLQQFYMAHSRGVYTPKSGTLSLYPRRPPSVSCNRCWHVGAPSVQARIPADFLSVVTTTVPNSYHPSKD